jgi:hypothetical protein
MGRGGGLMESKAVALTLLLCLSSAAVGAWARPVANKGKHAGDEKFLLLKKHFGKGLGGGIGKGGGLGGGYGKGAGLGGGGGGGYGGGGGLGSGYGNGGGLGGGIGQGGGLAEVLEKVAVLVVE